MGKGDGGGGAERSREGADALGSHPFKFAHGEGEDERGEQGRERVEKRQRCLPRRFADWGRSVTLPGFLYPGFPTS